MVGEGCDETDFWPLIAAHAKDAWDFGREQKHRGDFGVRKMSEINVVPKLVGWRGKQNYFIFFLGILAFLISFNTLLKFYPFRSSLINNAFCNCPSPTAYAEHGSDDIKKTLDILRQRVQEEIGNLRELAPESAAELRSAAFLADILGLIESIQTSQQDHHQQQQQQQSGEYRAFSGAKQPDEFFLVEEIRKYVEIKPNRLRKQNFMGANGTFTSIGHACFALKKDLEEYMEYDIGKICNDDWKLGQKLMVHGCDPLPRRRCFSRAPKLYNKPFPINESLWRIPDDRNIRWSQYRCKSFTCLIRNTTGKGFIKCTNCFNIADHEMLRWMMIKPEFQNSTRSFSNLTADFTIIQVLDLKPGEIRIGLDFSVGTGTFAARMREFNVTIVSATINLGAPFNEMIALRGLIPLYLTINQRLPFYDNTLDLIHTTRFLDGWIDFVLLEFILYDWDRVLRPGGILWIDSFFCLKKDLNDYLDAFKMLRYKKHMWVVIPKLDKDDREVFFSAVLEKPPRPF